MGVFPISQILRLGELDREGIREILRFASVGGDFAEIVGDGAVVAGRQLEGLDGEGEVGRLGDFSARFLHFGDDFAVIFRIRDDGDEPVVLGGGAQHRRSADIDIFDCVLQGAALLGDSLFEFVEVDDDHVDEPDAVLGKGLHVFRLVS